MADSTPLSWLFELSDKLSAPANAMTKSLDAMNATLMKVSGQLDKAQKATEKQGESMHKSKAHSEGFRHSLFETSVIAVELGHVMMEAGEKIFDFGKEAIEVAGFVEKIHLALETMMGSGEEATDLMERLESSASKLGLTGKEAATQATELISSGFNKTQLREALSAISDLQALNPTNAGAMSEATSMFANIQDMGKMTERAVMGLKGLKVSVPDVMANLATAYGVKTDAVKKLITEGKIDAAHGLEAIYKAISKKEHGPLGTAAEKFAHTVPGMMKILGGVPESMFAGLAGTKGYGQFKGFLSNLVSLTEPGSAFGNSLSSAIGETFSKVMSILFGDLAGPAGAAKLEQILMKVLDVIESVPDKVRAAKDTFVEWWPTIKLTTEAALGLWAITKTITIATNLWTVATTAASVVMGTWNALIWVGQAAWMAYDLAQAIGLSSFLALAGALALPLVALGSLAAAIYELIKYWHDLKNAFSDSAMWTQLGRFLTFQSSNSELDAYEAGAKHGDKLIAGAKDALEIHSPSKAMQELGEYARKGFDIGLNGDTTATQIATPQMSTASLSGGRGAVSVNVGGIEIHVDGHNGDATALASEIKQTLMNEMASVFEQIAIEQGVA